MRNAIDKEEWRQEMLQEAHEEGHKELLAYNDEEFAMNQCGVYEAYEELLKAINRVNGYGHNISLKDI